jgi:hypothetical protein
VEAAVAGEVLRVGAGVDSAVGAAAAGVREHAVPVLDAGSADGAGAVGEQAEVDLVVRFGVPQIAVEGVAGGAGTEQVQ